MGMLSLKNKIMMAISKIQFILGGAFIMFAATPIVSSFKLTKSNENKPATPHWEPLCDKQHQYLFSDESIDWESAREMCELLAGYLVRIDNRHENNCLLNCTMNNGIHAWWWTSGNDILTEGLYVFEDGTEMEWVSRWLNTDGAAQDGIIFNTDNNAYAGSWQDYSITSNMRYICERN